MKVLMINSVCGIRSTGRICTDLANALMEEGHTIKIAFGRENVPKQYEYLSIRIGSSVNVKAHAVLARLFDADGRGSFFSTKALIKQIDEFEPDIIHLHNLHGYYINHKELFDYIYRRSIKVIWTFHDMWPMTGHGCVCDAKGCNKWKEGCSSCPAFKSYPKSLIDRSSSNYKRKRVMFSRIPDLTIVTPSRWLAGIVEQSYLGSKKTIVIPNGIDTKLFRPVDNNFKIQHNLEEKVVVLGCSTWWNEEKGLYDFYKLRKMLDDCYTIVLVGLSKEQIKQLPDGIIGIERTDSVDKLVEIYSAADIFLNPTYIDNYPTVNLEALACRTPVLTYKTGGSAECLNGKNGKSFNKGDIESIAEFLMTQFRNTEFGFDDSNVLDMSTTCQKYMSVYMNMN